MNGDYSAEAVDQRVQRIMHKMHPELKDSEMAEPIIPNLKIDANTFLSFDGHKICLNIKQGDVIMAVAFGSKMMATLHEYACEAAKAVIELEKKRDGVPKIFRPNGQGGVE